VLTNTEITRIISLYTRAGHNITCCIDNEQHRGRDKSCNFPTEDIMGAQNFKFAPKFPTNGGFLAPNFTFGQRNFGQFFSDRLKFSGDAPAPLCATMLLGTKQTRQVASKEVDCQSYRRLHCSCRLSHVQRKACKQKLESIYPGSCHRSRLLEDSYIAYYWKIFHPTPLLFSHADPFSSD